MQRRLIGILATIALMAGLGASSATAGTTLGETMPGNNACSSDQTKIDPVSSGTYALIGGGTITIIVRSTAKGSVFDFTTTDAVVGSIVVKGGPNYHTYIFSPASEGETGLHAPLNPSNGKWYGLSHLCIGSEKKDDPDPKK